MALRLLSCPKFVRLINASALEPSKGAKWQVIGAYKTYSLSLNPLALVISVSMAILHASEIFSRDALLSHNVRLRLADDAVPPPPSSLTSAILLPRATSSSQARPTVSAGGWVGIILACLIFLAAVVAWTIIHKRSVNLRQKQPRRRDILLHGGPFFATVLHGE